MATAAAVVAVFTRVRHVHVSPRGEHTKVIKCVFLLGRYKAEGAKRAGIPSIVMPVVAQSAAIWGGERGGRGGGGGSSRSKQAGEHIKTRFRAMSVLGSICRLVAAARLANCLRVVARKVREKQRKRVCSDKGRKEGGGVPVLSTGGDQTE